MSRRWLFWCGVLGALGVLLGAFGAHLLRPWLPLQKLSIYETAVRYHLFHVLAMLGTALAAAHFPREAPWLRAAAGLFAGGIVLFSGSLYLLVLTDVELLGFVTPIGGLAFIAGWVALAWAFRGAAGRGD